MSSVTAAQLGSKIVSALGQISLTFSYPSDVLQGSKYLITATNVDLSGATVASPTPIATITKTKTTLQFTFQSALYTVGGLQTIVIDSVRNNVAATDSGQNRTSHTEHLDERQQRQRLLLLRWHKSDLHQRHAHPHQTHADACLLWRHLNFEL